MTDEEILLILAEAANDPIGRVVRTNMPEKARQRFYSVMRKHPFPLTISIPARAGEVWLVKKS